MTQRGSSPSDCTTQHEEELRDFYVTSHGSRWVHQKNSDLHTHAHRGTTVSVYASVHLYYEKLANGRAANMEEHSSGLIFLCKEEHMHSVT